MSRPALPLPNRLGDVFSAAEARALGVSSRRLLLPDVERVSRGIYRRTGRVREPIDPAPPPRHPAERWSIAQRETARALTPFLPPGSFFCRHTAAAIWRLPVPVPEAPVSEVDVACFAPRSAMRRQGVRGIKVHPALAMSERRGGIPVSDPASTWAMLAPSLGRNAAVALGDAVIREVRIPGTVRLERPPHGSLRDLEDLARTSRRPGGPMLRQILPLLSPHSASPPESDLRLLLQEWRLPRFELDHDVLDSEGRLAGCSEFAFPRYRLAVEYEGRGHLYDARQWNRDIEKYRRYEQLGWEAIRVTAELLYRRPEQLHGQILEALHRRGWSGSAHLG